MGPARPRADDGFTLIEVLVASFILLVGLMGTVTLVDSANARSDANKAREGATNLAREVSEFARTLPYAELATAGQMEAKLRTKPGFETDASPAPGLQVVRRGITYTVTPAVCAIDAAGDGYGDHSSEFCPGTPGPTIPKDLTPDDLRRVTVGVAYAQRGRTTAISMVSVINPSKQGSGPVVESLLLNRTVAVAGFGSDAAAPVITSSAVTQLVFRVKAAAGTTGIRWSAQGSMGPASSVTKISATEWEFVWPAPALDGNYTIGAQAVAGGDVGRLREIPVRLVRTTPGPPSGLVGGFNTISIDNALNEVAELQWDGSSLRTIEGYRVYRGSSTTPVACAGAATPMRATSCIDPSPPPQTAGEPDRTYRVVGLYYDAAGNLTETDPAYHVAQPVGSREWVPQNDDRTQRLRLHKRPTTGTPVLCPQATDSIMRDGIDGGPGSLTSFPLPTRGRSVTFCSEPYAAGVKELIAGTRTPSIVFTYENGSAGESCTVTATLERRRAGVTPFAIDTRTTTFLGAADARQGVANLTAFAVPTTPLVEGDSLALRLTFGNNGPCNKLNLHWGLYEPAGGTPTHVGRLDLGVRHTKQVLVDTTTRPDPPTNLRFVTVNGVPQLTWDAPTTGPAVKMYRVYRSGINLGERFNRTTYGSSDLFVEVPGAAATYRVTAVSPGLTESVHSVAVTGP